MIKTAVWNFDWFKESIYKLEDNSVIDIRLEKIFRGLLKKIKK